MRLSEMLWLYRARLRARAVLGQECFAIVGIAVGVALLFGSQIASTSLTRSISQLTGQIVGETQFQLDARSPAGFDERLLGEVRRLRGVRTALPVLEQQANVIGPRGRRSVDLIGTDPRLARLAGSLLRHFSSRQLAAQRAIVLPEPIAKAIGSGPLETVKLQIGAGVVETLLGAVLQESDIGGLVHSPVALAPVAYAQRLAGMPGRLTRIFVQAMPGHRSEVQIELRRLAAQAGVALEPAKFDSTLFAVAVAPDSKGEALFSAISALVGLMFALNAMLLTVPSRRKLIGDVRRQGATRLTTVQILLFDAMVIGVLACILGLALGWLLSAAVFHVAPGYLASAFPVGNERIVTWQSIALAVAVGLAAAAVGVLWPLHDTLARPHGEHTSKPTSRVWTAARLGTGLGCLAVTTTILVVRPQSAVFGSVTLVVALVCLLPSLFDGAVVVFERAQRRLAGAATVLAAVELQTPRTRLRSLTIAATGAIAVFGTVAIGGAQVNLQHGLDASARQIDGGADVWVSPGGESSLLTTVPFSAAAQAALGRVPGVKVLGVYRGSFLDWGDRRLWVLAPSNSSAQPIPPSQLLSGGLARAAARIRGGGWAVLSQGLAAEHHLAVGQAFTLPAPRPTTFKVAALTTNLGWPPGSVILSSAAYARAWGTSDPSAYEIQTEPGVSAATVRRLLQRALGPETGLVVETLAERAQRHYALIRQGLSRLSEIRLLVLIAAVLAVAGALGAMIWQRRDLVAFIKCQGYQRGVLWRWLMCESALMLGVGCFTGAVFGLYGQLLISHALASVTGFPISLNLEMVVALTSFALMSFVAAATVALPGYLVVRVPPRSVSPAY
jgi:putative ABC transport system permease protein